MERSGFQRQDHVDNITKSGSTITSEWNRSEIFLTFGNVAMSADFYTVLENWRRNGLRLNLLCGRIYVHRTALPPPNLNRTLLAAGKPLIGKIKGSVSKQDDD